MNIQIKCEDGVFPILLTLTGDEYFAVPVDSGENEEPIHTDESPLCEDESCPCRAEQQLV